MHSYSTWAWKIFRKRNLPGAPLALGCFSPAPTEWHGLEKRSTISTLSGMHKNFILWWSFSKLGIRKRKRLFSLSTICTGFLRLRGKGKCFWLFQDWRVAYDGFTLLCSTSEIAGPIESLCIGSLVIDLAVQSTRVYRKVGRRRKLILMIPFDKTDAMLI